MCAMAVVTRRPGDIPVSGAIDETLTRPEGTTGMSLELLDRDPGTVRTRGVSLSESHMSGQAPVRGARLRNRQEWASVSAMLFTTLR